MCWDITSRWLDHLQAAPDFRFVAKLYQGFTHRPVDEGRWAEEAQAFQAALEPLQRSARLSAILVQFPVTFLQGPAETRRLGQIRTLFPDEPGVVKSMLAVTRDITEPGSYSGLFPAETARGWSKFVARLRRLEALQGRVRKLEGK